MDGGHSWCEPEHIALLRSALRDVMARHLFTIDAIVILPDHLHAVWTLPAGDGDNAIRWSLIKSGFTRSCAPHCKASPSTSRRAHKEQAVWQHRFWEHAIRDEEDFARHVDYIHYNRSNTAMSLRRGTGPFRVSTALSVRACCRWTGVRLRGSTSPKISAMSRSG